MHASHASPYPSDARSILDQAGVAAISQQLELALFYDAQVDLRALYP
jgi:hypothetical protein